MSIRLRKGFTLVEVSLFLAVTVALFIGIAAGTQTSIYQQRYTDSVQNFAEFLRSIYSQTSNVQNESTGRSDKAIYGKVVTFSRSKEDAALNEVHAYNLIGDVSDGSIDPGRVEDLSCGSDGTVLTKLCLLDANVLDYDTNADGSRSYHTVGITEDYTVRWAAQLQTKSGWDTASVAPGYDMWEGIILVVHSPTSGNIFTYVMRADPTDTSYNYDERKMHFDNIISAIQNCNGSDTAVCTNPNPFVFRDTDGIDKSYFTTRFFDNNDVDFCVNPNGPERTTLRRNIRLASDVHNASGVQVVVDDDNRCL